MLRGRNLLGHAVFNARSLKHVVLQQLRSSASAHHLGLLSVEARPCTAPGARAWRQQSRCASTGGRAEPPAAAAAEDAAEAAAAGDAAAAAAAADDADDAAEGAADAGLTAAVSATTAAEQPPLEPALYVVGTPIGNLEDTSLRALRILRCASLILAEDTRHTRRLLSHFGIRTPTLSCHEHNERQRQELVLRRLQQGEPIALVSDAGMPGISDPGAITIAAAVAAGVRVVPVPGPCAAIAALAGGGLPTAAFHFAGFLPPKSGKRRAALTQLQHLPATLVFYAPPHGLAATLGDMVAVLGPQRQAVVARELTKVHEEFFRGTLQEVHAEFGPDGRRHVRGEVVLLVQGGTADPLQQLLAAGSSAAAPDAGAAAAAPAADAAAAAQPDLAPDEAVRRLVTQQLRAGASVSATARLLSRQLQVPRGRLYKLALDVEAQLQRDGSVG